MAVYQAVSRFFFENNIHDTDKKVLSFLLYGHGARTLELTLDGRLIKVECAAHGNIRLVTTLVEITDSDEVFTWINAAKTPEQAAQSVLHYLQAETDERDIEFGVSKESLIEEIAFGNELNGTFPIPAENTYSTFYLSAKVIDC